MIAHHLLALSLAMSGPAPEQPLAWITLPSGVTIRYLDQGSDDGDPLVFLHGLTDSWQSFARILPLIPDRFRVIAVDLRGHGGSDRPKAGYSMIEMADDVVLLLSSLGLDRATVVGHSMGSFVAREVARRAPRRVDRLVLVGSAVNPRNDVTVSLRRDIEALGELMPLDFVEGFQRSTFGRPVPDLFLGGVIAASGAVPPRVWRAALDGMLSSGGVAGARSLRLPTLLLWGEDDAVFSRSDQDQLLDAIAGSRLVAYRGVGHAPHWEVPDAFVSDLLAFVDGESERR